MILYIFALCVFALSCYGYGGIVFTVFYAGFRPSHSYIVALGIVFLAFIGGILNAAHAASTLPLSVCVYFGFLLGVFFLFRFQRRSPVALAQFQGWAYAVVLIGAGIFLVSNLLPASVFDFHDDFLAYLPRIVRMRETGTIGGNPWEILGLSDFGLQSFFQALLSTWLPINCAYAFDTIFCFILSLFLLVDIGRSKNCTTMAIVLAMAALVVINPQIVNISSVYSTAALVLALLIATRLFLDDLYKAAALTQLAMRAVPLCGIVVTIAALKLTTPFFLLPFCLIVFIATLIFNVRSSLVLAAAAILVGVVVLGGWMATHADKFNVWAWHAPVAPLAPDLVVYPKFAHAFQNIASAYGTSRAEYDVAIGVMLISATASLVFLFRQGRSVAHLLNVAAVFSGSCAYVGLAGTVNDEAALRYSIPFLIAIVPVTLLLHGPGFAFSKRLRLWQRGFAAALLVSLIALLGVFSASAAQRYARLTGSRTVVSFPVPEPLVVSEAQYLSDREKVYFANIQSKLPRGSTIWAWVDAPFQLDFARNQVWHFDHDWFATPWSMRVGAPNQLRQELLDHHVDYVLVQYHSVFMPSLQSMQRSVQGPEASEYRTIHQNTINLMLALETLATPFDVIYSDDRTLLISLRH